jgi:hypothetical protein
LKCSDGDFAAAALRPGDAAFADARFEHAIRVLRHCNDSITDIVLRGISSRQRVPAITPGAGTQRKPMSPDINAVREADPTKF